MATQSFPSWVPESFTAKVRGVDFPLADLHTLPEAALAKVFAYGLQRISNDAAASAKSDAEAVELAGKRWDNLRSGVIRASGSRIGDPVKRRALEIAEAKVRKSPKFIAWLAEKGLKVSSKEALKAIRANAEKFAATDAIMAQARIDVEAAKDIQLDVDFEV